MHLFSRTWSPWLSRTRQPFAFASSGGSASRYAASHCGASSSEALPLQHDCTNDACPYALLMQPVFRLDHTTQGCMSASAGLITLKTQRTCQHEDPAGFLPTEPPSALAKCDSMARDSQGETPNRIPAEEQYREAVIQIARKP